MSTALLIVNVYGSVMFLNAILSFQFGKINLLVYSTRELFAQQHLAQSKEGGMSKLLRIPTDVQSPFSESACAQIGRRSKP